jgi:type VII secretion protein EccB
MTAQPGPPRSTGDRSIGESAAPGGGTTRAQISGYNFLVRRMEHAIVRRDVRMLFDPMRSQSRAYVVGVILSALALAGCGVLALIHPQNKIGDNKILIGADSGQLYVRLGDTVHPALNLSSARLALGAADKPATIGESQLDKYSMGQLIGIPGAPSSMPHGADGAGKTWTVCDNDQTSANNTISTAVVVGNPQLGDNTSVLDPTHVLLVRAKSDSSATGQSSVNDNPVYLVYDGKRAPVNENSAAVMSGLGLQGVSPRPVSRALLDAIPKVPELDAPNISGMGSAPNFQMQDSSTWPADYKVGSVVFTTTNGVRQYYVVLNDGLQKVSEATSSIILAENNQNDAAQISQTLAADAPVSTQLSSELADYPQAKPQQVDAADTTPVACLSWKPLTTIANRSQSSITAQLTIFTGRALPVDPNTKPITLIQPSDRTGSAGDAVSAGDSNRADTVYITPGSGDYVETTGVEPDSQRSDNLFYIADTGVKFGIDQSPGKNNDDNAVKALGLTGVPAEPAPDQIVALLANGPTLSRQAAMVAHDGLTPDPAGTAVPDTNTPGSGN